MLCACSESLPTEPAWLGEADLAEGIEAPDERTAPIAVNDIIDVSGTAATITVPAASGVLDNDVLQGATLVGFGQVAGEMLPPGSVLNTPAGGRVELMADGALRYTPPAALPATGTDVFRYKLQNGIGSDAATVTVILGCGTETCNGCCAADGTCAGGTSDDACGADGEACAACSDVGTTCEAAVCTNMAVASNDLVDDADVHMRSSDDGRRIRRDVIRALWGERGYPLDLLPSEIELDVVPPIGGLSNLRRVDRLVVTLDHGFNSHAYVFRPVDQNRQLVIWHQSHSDDLGYGNGYTVVQRLLANGFTVVTMWMPLYGENTGPVSSHDELMSMTLPTGNPMRLLLEPAIAVVNWSEQSDEFREVAMMGLSGGGWTTTVVAALEPRIKRSIPVAGSLPLYMREARDRGDAEQFVPAIYGIAGYLDLYAQAALEPGRVQLQVLNRSDNCCFSAGTRAATYEPVVQSALAEIEGSGTWRLFVDDSQDDHRVSTFALDTAILPFLKADEEPQ